jgi:protein-S-isoprenylcysteine O-methyltransferase Ste14
MSSLVSSTDRALASVEPASARSRLLDRFERAIIVVFFLQLVVRMVWSAYRQQAPGALLMLPSEALVVVLVLLRRPAATISLRWQDWVCASVGTTFPMLISAEGAGAAMLPLYAAGLVATCGLIVQIHAKLSLGRSLGMVAANRGVRSHGPYRFIRHPMYAGYLLGQIAFLALFPSWWNAGVLAVSLSCQLQRIQSEERLLGQDAAYRTYRQSVRFRLVPGLF